MKFLKITNIKLNIDSSNEDAIKEAIKQCGIKQSDVVKSKILKYSIDARNKAEIKKLYSVGLTVTSYNKKRKNVQIFDEETHYTYDVTGTKSLENRPVIVGFGPAGMFCAFLLAKYGYRPIIVERGSNVEKRIKDVENFWNTGQLNENSNVQFGEGGAGTFSDGKLNTGIKDKKHRIEFVLQTLFQFGADEKITYEAKPHIGTDILCNVVKNMREYILSKGGTFYFDSTVTDILIKENKITDIIINRKEKIQTDCCIFAIGHSARDTFRMLYEKGVSMEQKPFALGVRIEHSQQMVNQSQYGFYDNRLGAAPYKLTYKTKENRGVYSFCMCPGGYVVNASSENGKLCVNGMSYSGRDSENANSAIVVTVTPNDFPTDHALSGIDYQQELERKAYQSCNGKVPIQLYKDFKNRNLSTGLGNIKPNIKGTYDFSEIHQILPDYICESIEEALEHFGNVIHGFNCDDAILSAVESRTSSPVRILRDDNFESNIKGLYPIGEGAGYAGGITSAAIDGIKVFEQIGMEFCP